MKKLATVLIVSAFSLLAWILVAIVDLKVEVRAVAVKLDCHLSAGGKLAAK